MLSFMTKQNTWQFLNHESDSDCSVYRFEALIESGFNKYFIVSPQTQKYKVFKIYTLYTIFNDKVNNLYFIKRLLINKSLRRALNQIA